jgi:NTE family protein
VGCVELFHFLDQNNIPIDLIVGCSGGSIFTVMRVLGYSTDRMKELFCDYVNKRVFESIDYLGAIRLIWNINYRTFPSLLKGNAFKESLDELFGDTLLENLPIKTVIQATDFDTGEEICIEKGNASDAIYASSTVVPLLPMIELNGRKLIDGGYTNSLPITTALNRDADIIIAMGFSEKVEQTKSIFEATVDFISMVSRENRSWKTLVELDYQHYHEIIIVDVAYEQAIPWSDPDNIDLIFKKSKKAVEQAAHQIVSAVETWYKK